MFRAFPVLAARLCAGLRAFALSLRASGYRGGRGGSVRAGRLALYVLAFAVLAVQAGVQRHALSHLQDVTPAAVVQGAAPDQDDARHLGHLCLECLALAALDLPPVVAVSFPLAALSAPSRPVAAVPARCGRGVWRPPCRAPPSSVLPPFFV